jgi:hypothetical protein
MDRVTGVSMLTKQAKDASHELYITRFTDDAVSEITGLRQIKLWRHCKHWYA